MLPIELAVRHDDRQARLLLRLPPELFWFKGHFPGRPLLPGVAQLDWVMHYGRTLLAPDWVFSHIESVKFQRPVLPGHTVSLVLDWHRDRCRLAFSYHIQPDGAGEAIIASSGKIGLCQ